MSCIQSIRCQLDHLFFSKNVINTKYTMIPSVSLISRRFSQETKNNQNEEEEQTKKSNRKTAESTEKEFASIFYSIQRKIEVF